VDIKQTSQEDRSLLQRIERGDDQAIASFYDRYSGVVYSLAFHILRDPALAEQILSGIFVDVASNPRRFLEIHGNLALSITMLARNRAVALLLHQPAPDFDCASPNCFANADDLSMTREEACSAIDRLPVERRMRLERVFFQGATEPAFATSTAVPAHATQYPVSEAVARLSGTGLEVIDLEADPSFARRHLHARDAVSYIDGMNRLARVFAENPTQILEQLVAAAVELCGADSAGISIEQKDGTDDNFYRWAATAGQYSGFADAKLPRYPSACGVTLERGRPQIFRVSQLFFDLMGIQAPIVTDGLLLPWQVDDTRGTIWIMAHGREQAFDPEDCRMMQALANFAATGVRLQQQHQLLMQQAKTEAQAAMANKLAHQINNPLQGLMQTVFLFGKGSPEPSVFAQQAMGEVSRLSDLVKSLLSSPN
jgi:DNA-directed RNA polymerase specialized sigma24 family protein